MGTKSEELFAKACELFPGGVNSPVRAFRAVGGTPRFIARGQGPYIWDAEGQRYIDYIGSWGPMILGHGHPAVREAVQQAATEGFSFGAPTEREIELAEEILKLVPSIDQVRLVDFRKLVDPNDAVQGVDVVLTPLGIPEQRLGEFRAGRFTAGHPDFGTCVA